MMWSRWHTLIAGCALIVLSNAVALIGVAYNRSSEPESRLNLTQRELREDYRFDVDNDNSGLTLSLSWRVLTTDSQNVYDYGSYNGAADWLSTAKLESLGFDLSLPAEVDDRKRVHSRQLPKEVFVVLELDGPAYQFALQRAQQAAEQASKVDQQKKAVQRLVRERTANSRLFAVDAGKDIAMLRAQYPDRERYAIVRGSVRMQWLSGKSPRWGGYIAEIANDRVHVPLEFQPAIQMPQTPRGESRSDAGVPFQATVAFGKRLEPWILAASARKP